MKRMKLTMNCIDYVDIYPGFCEVALFTKFANIFHRFKILNLTIRLLETFLNIRMPLNALGS